MNIDMIRASAARAKGHVRRTPLLNSHFLDEIAGRRVWVKPECLQHTGSFKFRGAWSALSALNPEARAKGVIAYSSGNHAQGVALASKMHGAPLLRLQVHLQLPLLLLRYLMQVQRQELLLKIDNLLAHLDK